MERRLGRGLESLLGGAAAKGPGPTAEAGPRAGGELPIQDVRPNPNQPRKVFDSAQLEELRDSIERHGVLQPICVRRREQGYEIVAGERRWRAARLAGHKTIPAVVLEDVQDDRMLELALVENLQRQDLDPLEKARGFREMQERLRLTQDEVAERVGLKRSTVANHLRLLDLPSEVQEAVVSGVITMGHARALLGAGDAQAVKRMLARTVREDLSVRQIERLVRELRIPAPGTGDSGGAPKPSRPVWVRDLEERMRRHLGTKVTILYGSGFRGQIVIQYHDREELDRLSQVLGPKDEL